MKNPPIYAWLKSNLGKNCLAPLTGTDARALIASVEIMELYSVCKEPGVLIAFREIVLQMQPQCRELAFHAIAMKLDWSDRNEVWCASNLYLDHPLFKVRVCAFESGGAR